MSECLTVPPDPYPVVLAEQRVRFGPRAWLTRDEVFSACQALADAGSHLHRVGQVAEADALGHLFVLLEGRLVRQAGEPAPERQASSGLYSMESEFTQYR